MKRWYILCSLLVLVLMGCQSESFTLNEDITQIEVIKLGEVSPSPEVYQNDQGEVIKKITNQKEVEEIIKEIEGAEVSSLKTGDIDLPIHKLRFIQNDTLILTLGYYPANEERKQSSLIDLEKDLLYVTKSPIMLLK